jgi:hypothetical protein
MLSALNDSQDSFDELAKCIDPNLTSYDKDSLYEVWLISTFSCAFEVLRSVWLLSRNKKDKNSGDRVKMSLKFTVRTDLF